MLESPAIGVILKGTIRLMIALESHSLLLLRLYETWSKCIIGFP